jgi:hypothetical protein
MKLLSILSIILTFIILVASGFVCYKTNNNTLTGKWRLIKYYNLTAGTSETEPANIPRSIIIEFSDNGGEGKMNGHTVTNSVSGAYELLKNNKMKTISFGGTKVAELGWGSKFWNAIHSASSFERHGNKLFIFFDNDREKMEFNKE